MFYRRLLDVPAWGLRRPFQDLERMRRQMDQLFDTLSDRKIYRTGGGVFPAINLTEDTQNYYIRAELPGVKAGELDIQAASKNITLSGERKFSAEGGNTKYHRKEREAGKFSRIIGLPGDIDIDNVNASLKNGMLTVVVPKAEAAKPKQITVK